MNAKFEILIYWSDEDQAFIAEIPELPGCIAHGANHSEALKNIEQATELWLETAQKTGREIPKPKGRKLMYA